jgi:DNA modification methylase
VTVRILTGDCRATLATLDAGNAQMCVTSPPYFGLRDYGHAGQIGLEATPDAYVAELVAVFREVRRVLKDDGTLWLNLGDSYSANRGYQVPDSKHRDVGNSNRDGVTNADVAPKNLLGIPWRVAFALQVDGWYLRSDIIWHKPNPMPESVTDRPTKSHEYLFLLAKSPTYYYDADAIAEDAQNWGTRDRTNMRGGTTDPKLKHHGLTGKADDDNATRNKRTVWTVPTSSYKGAHFATFPPALIEPCILAGSTKGDTVLDPFGGAGTTGLVADRLGRDAVLCELNPAYAEMAERRIHNDNPLFSAVEEHTP